MKQVPVIVVGGGPVGLALAADLGWRGVDCLLVERNADINRHPRANVVGARSMEHFRRLGIADEVAKAGLPLDYPVEIVFTTRILGQEIFRFSFPSYAACSDPTEALLETLPDLRHSPYFKTSVGQDSLEPVLRRLAESFSTSEVRFGTELVDFKVRGDGVTAVLADSRTGKAETVHADYLVACDGGRSPVREKLGIGLAGQADLGRFLGVFIRAPDFMRRIACGPATLYWALNADSPGIFIATDGREHFAFQRSLRPHEAAEDIDLRAAIDGAFGGPLDAEILSVQPWKAHRLVAERLSQGRVFLAGDAAHLFVPTGGFGMNTGLGDAFDLGWKLAAVLQGWGGPGLLASYDAERRPVAIRNTAEAADNYLKILPSFALGADSERPGDAGRDVRQRIASALAGERKHFAATGVHLGYTYGDSPIVVSDGTPAGPDNPQAYVPGTRPGARAPHLWLAPGRSTLDLFGWTYVLVGTGGDSPEPMMRAARRQGMPLRFVTLDRAATASAYDRLWTLVRPDGHVAWRGNSLPADPDRVIATVRGAA